LGDARRLEGARLRTLEECAISEGRFRLCLYINSRLPHLQSQFQILLLIKGCDRVLDPTPHKLLSPKRLLPFARFRPAIYVYKVVPALTNRLARAVFVAASIDPAAGVIEP
jgi:hypothetical protein